MTLIWNGPAVKARIEGAVEGALNETTEATAELGKTYTPVGETGEARDSVRALPARRNDADRMSSRVGSWFFRYFFIEVGANGRPGLSPLRRAAAAEFPRLAERIRSRLP